MEFEEYINIGCTATTSNTCKIERICEFHLLSRDSNSASNVSSPFKYPESVMERYIGSVLQIEVALKSNSTWPLMKWRVVQEPLERGVGEVDHLHRHLKHELKFVLPPCHKNLISI